MRVGFTGTQRGRTIEQATTVRYLLASLGPLSTGGHLFEPEQYFFHHGLCIGSDAQSHVDAVELGYRTVGHPPDNPSKRADCRCDEMREPAPYLVRNKDIVDAVNVMIGTPGEIDEQLRGSGTWATIRWTRRTRKPLFIVYPDGDVRRENMNYWTCGRKP